MTFLEAEPLIREFLEDLDSWMLHAFDKERARLCKDCLEVIRVYARLYDAHIKTTDIFRAELMRAMCGPVNDDALFSMIEALAVLVREKTLWCRDVFPAEKKLMNYFENSGYWNAGDGTLVSSFYYVYVPTSLACLRSCI